MIWYHLIFSDNKKAVGYAWNLMGFVAKLAQGVSHIYILYNLGVFSSKLIFSFFYSARIAYVVVHFGEVESAINFSSQLDRDAPRMKGIPEEHEKRRSVFWELLNMDCRMVCSMDGFLFPLLIFYILFRVFHLDDHLQYS